MKTTFGLIFRVDFAKTCELFYMTNMRSVYLVVTIVFLLIFFVLHTNTYWFAEIVLEIYVMAGNSELFWINFIFGDVKNEIVLETWFYENFTA